MEKNEKTILTFIRYLINEHPELAPSIAGFLASIESPNWTKFEDLRNQFLAQGGKISHLYPILSDFEGEAGTARGHYFHQDLLVAQKIFNDSPTRHIDVGSRVDGFVAHVASFRPIEIIDIRDLNSTGHHNITFIRSDLMNIQPNSHPVCDSISCLHAIEHFGLGRYGDPIDPLGHHRGFLNLLKMLSIGGKLYISFPIGIRNEVHFNAHRVFHPTDVLQWPECCSSLELLDFSYVDDYGTLHTNVDLLGATPTVAHGCGIYTFRKI